MTPERLTAIRLQLKMTQRELATLLDYAAETISRAETGAIPLTLPLAQALLDLADLDECPHCGQPLPQQSSTLGGSQRAEAAE